jgi:hypothetical protein
MSTKPSTDDSHENSQDSDISFKVYYDLMAKK